MNNNLLPTSEQIAILLALGAENDAVKIVFFVEINFCSNLVVLY
jgi:ABC-type lipoprotein release transport system permease subunit